MPNAVQPFNPNDVVKTVRDRIRDQFVSLIPEEVFTKMVQSEIDAFMKPVESYYSHNQRRSPMQDVIAGVLEEAARTEVKQLLADPNGVWRTYWHDNGSADANTGVNKLLREHSGEIVARTLSTMFQSVLNQMASRS
jgi:uncharacterized Fe-S cluster-containing MiaB family protein